MATQWPLIKAGLIALLPTLPGWSGVITTVYGGPIPTSSPPAKYGQVGFNGDGQSGTYTTDQDDSGFQLAEQGSIYGEVCCSQGGSDASVTEAQVQAALDGLEGAVRADRTLGGILPPESSVSFTVTLAPVNQNGTGYVARWVISYLAVT